MSSIRIKFPPSAYINSLLRPRNLSSATRAPRPAPPLRSEFSVFQKITTRWADNDTFGHINNAVYYQYFDSAVNHVLMSRSGVDIRKLNAIGIVAETSCQFYLPLSFPQTIDVGICIEHLGSRSIVYRVAAFASDSSTAAACGKFVHVYCDTVSRKPVSIPTTIIEAILPLQIPLQTRSNSN